jgi:UDP-N-acetylmuramoylalanine--D-glutamate ligase
MVVVVGMARSGIAAARLLHDRGYRVFVSDSGQPASVSDLTAAGIAYETGRHTTQMFVDAEEIVVSPGVPLDIEPLRNARKRGVPIVSELEVAFRYLQGDIVAITGSNGKTTTTTLVGEILRDTGRPVQVGGNIGTAMSSLVNTSTSNTVNVVEVSSFQLDGTRKFRPGVAVLLNITPDHLDRYRDFADYRTSKFRIFRNQESSDIAVLNRDDPQVWPPPVQLRATHSFFSRKEAVAQGAHQSGDTLFLDGAPIMKTTEIALRGVHNIENVLASLAVARVYAIAPDSIAAAVRGFRGVEHRLEAVASIGGVAFYNDSKATNVDSSIKAVESFASGIILILGGKDKGASYQPLIRSMKGRVKHVLLIGAAANKISAEIGDLFPKTFVTSLDDAVEKGLRIGVSGDTVLLSPACASFDMFDNYEHRGQVFKKAVEKKSWQRE